MTLSVNINEKKKKRNLRYRRIQQLMSNNLINELKLTERKNAGSITVEPGNGSTKSISSKSETEITIENLKTIKYEVKSDVIQSEPHTNLFGMGFSIENSFIINLSEGILMPDVQEFEIINGYYDRKLDDWF